jgi:hypothetical protein
LAMLWWKLAWELLFEGTFTLTRDSLRLAHMAHAGSY